MLCQIAEYSGFLCFVCRQQTELSKKGQEKRKVRLYVGGERCQARLFFLRGVPQYAVAQAFFAKNVESFGCLGEGLPNEETKERRTLHRLVGYGWTILVLCMAWPSWASDVQVQLLDIGAGEATLIRAGGQDVLINAGAESSASRLVKLLKAQGVQRLSLLVIVQHDSLRAGGCKAILEAFSVERFLGPRGGRRGDGYKALLRKLRKRRISTKPARKGEIFSVGSAQLRVLDSGTKGRSLILRIEQGVFSVLFLGALREDGVRGLLRKRAALRSGIVKLAEFGREASNPENLLRAVGAKMAVASTSQQGAFTLAEEVSARLRGMRTKIASVAREGHLWLRSDGRSVWISTAKRHTQGYVLLERWQEQAPVIASDQSETSGATGTNIRLDELPSDDDAGRAIASSRNQGPEKPAPAPQAMQEDGSWYRTPALGKDVINPPPFPATKGYIGHKKSRFFHRADCRSRLFIPEAQRAAFASREQALRKGRVPAGDCHP